MAARTVSLLPIATKPVYPLYPSSTHLAIRLSSPISLPPPLLLRSPSLRSAAAVVLSLPVVKPESASTEKMPKWSARAIKAFSLARQEAKELKHKKTGTECLLLGILVEGASEAAKFLRANGITIFKMHDEIIKLLGKAYMYADPAIDSSLTEQVQRALAWAIDEKLKSAGEDGEITTEHMLLGIWSVKESSGHIILSSLGIDDQKISELAKSANKDESTKYRYMPWKMQNR